MARAMREQGVDLILAHSPQAKGRVERCHGLFQDRLVKEMRLRGICSIEAANAYLDGAFLALVLSWQEPRSVAKEWTVRWRNRHFQIDACHAAPGFPGRRVVVV